MCTMVADFGSIPRHKVTKFGNPIGGETAYYVPFKLRITEVDNVGCSLPTLNLVTLGESVLTRYPMQVLKFELIFDGTPHGIIEIPRF
jgi:hypothetical protein